jgi:FAD/FMN-containing dehydrogenase
MKTENTTVRNWGNYPEAFARVHTPANTDELSSLFQTPGPLLARGNGRCYGDAALADVLVSTLQLKAAAGTLAETDLRALDSLLE